MRCWFIEKYKNKLSKIYLNKIKMTLYNNLPLYKETYELLLLTFEIIKNFERQYKYTLWDKIKNEIIDLISTIYRANSSSEMRITNIRKAREQIEVLKLYFRLSKDLKIISIHIFASLSLKWESISKQLFAWEKSCFKN